MIVDSITNDPTAGQFDFATIPAGYSRLILRGFVRSSEITNALDQMFLFFNGLFTETDYHRQRMYAWNSSSMSTEEFSDPEVCLVTAGGATAGAYAFINVTIEGYDDTTIIKGAIGQYGMQTSSSTALAVGSNGMSHDTLTDAITRITLRADQHSTYGLLGTVKLYAEN